jgi:glycosyltransferase involved in cell wall biosynthesis
MSVPSQPETTGLDSARPLVLLIGPYAPEASGVAAFQRRLDAALACHVRTDRIDVSAYRAFGLAAGVPHRPAPDVLLFSAWVPFTAPFYRRVQERYASAPAYALAHSYEPRHLRGPLHRLMRRSLSAYDSVAALRGTDPSLLARAPRWLSHPATDYGPPVARADACARLGLDPARTWLLHFGFGRAYKGLATTCRALGHLDPSVSLLVAGRQVHGLPPEVAFLDPARVHVDDRAVPNADVPLYFGAASRVLLPYLRSVSSGVGSIAAHYGVPVVASDFPALHAVARLHPAGATAPPGDARALADAIRRSLAATVLSPAPAAAPSWDAFARDLLSLVLPSSRA